MNKQEYDQQKRECWEEFCQHIVDEEEAFYNMFDRAYALSREKETITQEGIEKAAIEYVLTRQQARHNAKKEEDATMRDFDKTIKAWDAYDMEQAFESGANLFLGKQEKDADTVIQGWVCRDKVRNEPFTSDLFIVLEKPTRVEEWGKWCDCGDYIELDSTLFPDLTWDDEPEQIEIILKRKKK